jgi:hypothetical protein
MRKDQLEQLKNTRIPMSDAVLAKIDVIAKSDGLLKNPAIVTKLNILKANLLGRKVSDSKELSEEQFLVKFGKKLVKIKLAYYAARLDKTYSVIYIFNNYTGSAQKLGTGVSSCRDLVFIDIVNGSFPDGAHAKAKSSAFDHSMTKPFYDV